MQASARQDTETTELGQNIALDSVMTEWLAKQINPWPFKMRRAGYSPRTYAPRMRRAREAAVAQLSSSAQKD